MRGSASSAATSSAQHLAISRSRSSGHSGHGYPPTGVPAIRSARSLGLPALRPRRGVTLTTPAPLSRLRESIPQGAPRTPPPAWEAEAARADGIQLRASRAERKTVPHPNKQSAA